MERVVIAAVLVVVALVVAALLQRRKPEPPTQARWAVPTQLDRADFGGADVPWLVAVFTSSTCDSCGPMMEKASVLASSEVHVEEVPYQAQRVLHARYRVEVVPLLLVADEAGVVRASFIGVPSATDLWAAVAEARAPGSSPEPGLGRPAQS